jgi:hypothetical protein
MNKPIYKSATVLCIISGTALAYIYLKTIGKDKNLQLTKTLLIGAGVGLGLGLGIDLSKGSSKPITEEELNEMAKSIGSDTEEELKSYLSALNTSEASEDNKQRFFRALKGFLKAKKDKVWDTKGDINMKKKVLLSYGVTNNDVDFFENTLKNHLTNFASRISIKN